MAFPIGNVAGSLIRDGVAGPLPNADDGPQPQMVMAVPLAQTFPVAQATETAGPSSLPLGSAPIPLAQVHPAAQATETAGGPSLLPLGSGHPSQQMARPFVPQQAQQAGPHGGHFSPPTAHPSPTSMLGATSTHATATMFAPQVRQTSSRAPRPPANLALAGPQLPLSSPLGESQPALAFKRRRPPGPETHRIPPFQAGPAFRAPNGPLSVPPLVASPTFSTARSQPALPSQSDPQRARQPEAILTDQLSMELSLYFALHSIRYTDGRTSCTELTSKFPFSVVQLLLDLALRIIHPLNGTAIEINDLMDSPIYISAEEKAQLVPFVRYLAILSLGRSDTGRMLLLVDPFNPRAGMLPQVTAMVEEAEWWKQLSDAMDAAPAVPDGAGPNVQ